MTCSLCSQRKAKRACPALRRDICAACCGTKRLAEIDCPSDCVFLDAAHRHPAAAVRRRQEHDLSILIAAIGRPPEPQLHLLFVLLTVILRHVPQGLARLLDEDVADAAAALAASRETSARGVIYEHQAASASANDLRRALAGVLDEVGKGGGSRFDRDAAIVLRGIERGARHEVPGLEGPIAYLDLIARVLQEQPRSGKAEGDASNAGGSIILP